MTSQIRSAAIITVLCIHCWMLKGKAYSPFFLKPVKCLCCSNQLRVSQRVILILFPSWRALAHPDCLLTTVRVKSCPFILVSSFSRIVKTSTESETHNLPAVNLTLNFLGWSSFWGSIPLWPPHGFVTYSPPQYICIGRYLNFFHSHKSFLQRKHFSEDGTKTSFIGKAF